MSLTQQITSSLSTNNGESPTTIVIGLTGGIGSGKSAASAWFAKQGIEVIDADVIAHAVVAKGSPTLAKIQRKLGDWVLLPSGEMDRAAVRAHVFNHPDALMTLEAITHPAIREAAKQQLVNSRSPYSILVAPLLIEAAEAGLANLCQRILVIDAPEEEQLARASMRDDQSVAKIKNIMANQLARSERNKHADDVVYNESSLEALYAQLEPLHVQYLSLAGI